MSSDRSTRISMFAVCDGLFDKELKVHFVDSRFETTRSASHLPHARAKSFGGGIDRIGSALYTLSSNKLGQVNAKDEAAKWHGDKSYSGSV